MNCRAFRCYSSALRRAEILNGEIFYTLEEAKVAIEE
jgi:hypothetical protein